MCKTTCCERMGSAFLTMLPTQGNCKEVVAITPSAQGLAGGTRSAHDTPGSIGSALREGISRQVQPSGQSRAFSGRSGWWNTI